MRPDAIFLSGFLALCGLCISAPTATLATPPDTATSDDTWRPSSFWAPAPAYHTGRVRGLAISGAATYAGTFVALNELWYKGHARTAFHFFDDSQEWLQVDKAGHVHTAYFMGVWGNDLLHWSGAEPHKARWYGGLAGSAFLLIVEVLDGFSAEWGFSWADFAANTLGSAWFIGQDACWGEQRLSLKFSYRPVTYPEDVQSRARALYGMHMPEQLLKDYNAQQYWISANIASFLPEETPFPKWLNLAAGYSANGMLGGFDNVWTTHGITVDRSDIPRTRQYFLSLDVDLRRIKTGSHFANTVLKVLNVIKIPAPALRYDQHTGWRGFWLYF